YALSNPIRFVDAAGTQSADNESTFRYDPQTGPHLDVHLTVTAEIHKGQQPTLAEARATGIPLSSQPLQMMDVNTLMQKPANEHREWYMKMLGRFEHQLSESSDRYKVPKQLLAALILNELADIGSEDVGNYWLPVSTDSKGRPWHGSVGIAQIQIDTAI